MIQQNPRLINRYVSPHQTVVILYDTEIGSLLQDPRMIDVLGALMGIDLQASTRPEDSDELPSGIKKDSSPSSPQAPTPSSSKPSKAEPEPVPAEEDIEMEDDDETRAKKAAEVAKEAGNAAYKSRNFEEAAKQFQLAWDTWPQNVAYLTNLGGECVVCFLSSTDFTLFLAVYFEQGDYDKAIETCEKAIEEGRSVGCFFFLLTS